MLHYRGGETPAQKAQSTETPPPANTKLQIKALDQICGRAPSSIYDGSLTSLDEHQPSQTCVTVPANDEFDRALMNPITGIASCGAPRPATLPPLIRLRRVL
jgi:hypothetical protein